MQIQRVDPLPLRRRKFLLQIFRNGGGFAEFKAVDFQHRYATGQSIASPLRLPVFTPAEIHGLQGKGQSFLGQRNIHAHDVRGVIISI
ncbi:hypothetical protein D3C76_1661970 [compost metagenome]